MNTSQNDYTGQNALELYHSFKSIISKEEFKKLIQLDPTATKGNSLETFIPGKYTPWLLHAYGTYPRKNLKNYMLGKSTLIAQGLQAFHLLTASPKGKTSLQNYFLQTADTSPKNIYDIQSYTLRDIFMLGAWYTPDNLKKALTDIKDDIDVIINDAVMFAFCPLSMEAALYYAKDTPWKKIIIDSRYLARTSEGKLINPAHLIMIFEKQGDTFKQWCYFSESKTLLDQYEDTISRKEFIKYWYAKGDAYADAISTLAQYLEQKLSLTEWSFEKVFVKELNSFEKCIKQVLEGVPYKKIPIIRITGKRIQKDDDKDEFYIAYRPNTYSYSFLGFLLTGFEAGADFALEYAEKYAKLFNMPLTLLDIKPIRVPNLIIILKKFPELIEPYAKKLPYWTANKWDFPQFFIQNDYDILLKIAHVYAQNPLEKRVLIIKDLISEEFFESLRKRLSYNRIKTSDILDQFDSLMEQFLIIVIPELKEHSSIFQEARDISKYQYNNPEELHKDLINIGVLPREDIGNTKEDILEDLKKYLAQLFLKNDFQTQKCKKLFAINNYIVPYPTIDKLFSDYLFNYQQTNKARALAEELQNIKNAISSEHTNKDILKKELLQLESYIVNGIIQNLPFSQITSKLKKILDTSSLLLQHQNPIWYDNFYTIYENLQYLPNVMEDFFQIAMSTLFYETARAPIETPLLTLKKDYPLMHLILFEGRFTVLLPNIDISKKSQQKIIYLKDNILHVIELLIIGTLFSKIKDLFLNLQGEIHSKSLNSSNIASYLTETYSNLTQFTSFSFKEQPFVQFKIKDKQLLEKLKATFVFIIEQSQKNWISYESAQEIENLLASIKQSGRISS